MLQNKLTWETILITKSILDPPNKHSLFVSSLFHHTVSSREEVKECRATCLKPSQYINVPITQLPANP